MAKVSKQKSQTLSQSNHLYVIIKLIVVNYTRNLSLPPRKIKPFSLKSTNNRQQVLTKTDRSSTLILQRQQ